MKNTIYLCAAIIFFSACNQKAAQKSKVTIETPKELKEISGHLKQVELNTQHFTIDAQKGEQIVTPNGAKIIIAPGSFVDAAGNPVQGNVDVSYKAINSIAEIVASGIPMQAMNGNEVGQFISDGMFEIGATSNGSAVQVASGKTLEVFTPARDTKSDFNFWYFDAEKGGWQDLGKRNGAVAEKDIESVAKNMGVNPKTGITAFNLNWHKIQSKLYSFASANEQEEGISPSKIIPGKYNPKQPTLDITFDKYNYPDLAVYNSIMWQFAGDNPALDPAKNNWIFQSAWTNVNLKPSANQSGLFDLSIQVSGKEFHTVVRPVVAGKDAQKADEAYQAEIEKLQKLQALKASEGASKELIEKNMYNAFSVAQLGTYNCDRFYSDPQAKDYTADFNFDGKKLAEGQTIYVLFDRRKGVIQYSAGQKIKINPHAVDAIFTIAANGVIATVGAEGLSNMREKSGGKISLGLQQIKTKITSLMSLNQALNEI